MATRTVDLGKVVGPPGPNSVSSTTATNLTGVLAGNGSTVEVKPVDATPTANSGNLVTSGAVAAKASSLAAGMAIIATGNTHAAITTGQYVYIQGHATLPEGMYEATANIAANGTLSTSNVTAKTEGAANALKAALNSKADLNEPLRDGGEFVYLASAGSTTISLAPETSSSAIFLIIVARYTLGATNGLYVLVTNPGYFVLTEIKAPSEARLSMVNSTTLSVTTTADYTGIKIYRLRG